MNNDNDIVNDNDIDSLKSTCSFIVTIMINHQLYSNQCDSKTKSSI